MRPMQFVLLLVFSTLGACGSVPPEVARTWELPAGVKTMRVNGYDMAYVERGTGVPIVLVHGAFSDYRYYAAQMEPLSAKYRVISVSLRHYYPEHWNGNGNDFSYRQHADDLAAFIQALGAGPVHVVGHSRGGSVAMHMASAHPELVRSLVVAEGGRNIPAFMPTEPQYAEETKQSAAVSAQVLALLQQGKTEAGLAMFAAAVNGPRAWEEKYPEPVRQAYRDNAWTIKGMAADTGDGYTCADAAGITAPTLLLGADQSPVVFRLVLDRIQACMKTPERGLIANSAHSMPRLNPSAFNQAVLAFVAAH